MELIVGLIIAGAAYFAGTDRATKQAAPTEIEQCANLCEKGVVSRYKWCKCLTKPMWETTK